MTETLRRAGQPMSLYRSFGFFVLAPALQIEAGMFSSQMSKDGIRGRLVERVQMYDSQPNRIELQKWLDQRALPLVGCMELSCCSWEWVIDPVSVAQPEYGASLDEFYQFCLKYNARAGITAA